MRDLNRIDIITEKLNLLWHKYPDLRLGQLIKLIDKGMEDNFYVEDDEWLRMIEERL